MEFPEQNKKKDAILSLKTLAVGHVTQVKRSTVKCFVQLQMKKNNNYSSENSAVAFFSSVTMGHGSGLLKTKKWMRSVYLKCFFLIASIQISNSLLLLLLS